MVHSKMGLFGVQKCMLTPPPRTSILKFRHLVFHTIRYPHHFLQDGGPPDSYPRPRLHCVLLPHQAQGLPELLLAALEPKHDIVNIFWISRGRKWET